MGEGRRANPVLSVLLFDVVRLCIKKDSLFSIVNGIFVFRVRASGYRGSSIPEVCRIYLPLGYHEATEPNLESEPRIRMSWNG
jgi:hypothetical protein